MIDVQIVSPPIKEVDNTESIDGQLVSVMVPDRILICFYLSNDSAERNIFDPEW